MEWVRENWFWIVVVVLFLWIHTKMHGGHGHGGPSHRGHGHGEGGHRGSGDGVDHPGEQRRC